jgi:hypothetical protein
MSKEEMSSSSAAQVEMIVPATQLDIDDRSSVLAVVRAANHGNM